MIYKSPVYRIIAVPVEKIEPNTYNPNSVAPPELRLGAGILCSCLERSIDLAIISV